MKTTTDKVEDFIRRFAQQNPWPPTRREIGLALGISTTAANYHVNKLARQGRLVIARQQARGIQLVETA